MEPNSTRTEDAVATLAERVMSVEEFDAWVSAPMSEDEMEEIRGLMSWFLRRYPTALQRLAAARRSIQDAARLAAAGRSLRRGERDRSAL